MSTTSEEDRSRKKLRLMSDKNATAGDGARSMDRVLDKVRPPTMCLDKSAASASDPATMRQGAIDRFGDLESKEQKTVLRVSLERHWVQDDKRQNGIDRFGDLKIDVTGSEVVQFHSKYMSQVLPFVIPRMVSGPYFSTLQMASWRE